MKIMGYTPPILTMPNMPAFFFLYMSVTIYGLLNNRPKIALTIGQKMVFQ